MRQHALHVYRDDTGLATTVAAFLSPALGERHAILSIGTRAHIAAIEQRLRTDGHDMDGARRRGLYLSLDAERVIAPLLRDGLPTRETFDEVVGRHIARLERDHRGVRAFGEVVSLLWRDGKRAAALRIEDLWNDAVGHHRLAVACGYAERALGGGPIDQIVAAHDRSLGDRPAVTAEPAMLDAEAGSAST